MAKRSVVVCGHTQYAGEITKETKKHVHVEWKINSGVVIQARIPRNTVEEIIREASC